MKQWQLYTSNELKPQGWLKRQLEIQAEGLSGNLDKMWPDVKDSAWIGGDREGWERVPYWLDGFIPLAYLLENEDMISRARKYIDAIIAGQKEDGWICPCREDEIEKYDTWAVQLITKVLVVYYECSKDERIPGVVYNALKNYYELLKAEKIRLFDWGKFRWFEAFIAINFTYERYQENWLLELAKLMREQGANYNDYIESWKRPLNKWTFYTHIVNLGMMLKTEAVSCDLLGEEYTDNAEFLRSILEKYNGTVYESFTGDECLSGLSPVQGTELCAIVEQMYSYELLYAYTGDSKWAERLEVLAFNALPATISDDMWVHQYVQLSNQIACQRFPGRSQFRTNGPDAHMFGLEPNFGCCTANFNQGWPKFALSAFMHNEDTIINSVMLPSELKTEGVNILLETNYPFENAMTYKINAEKEFSFKVRVPSFAQKLTITSKGAGCEKDMTRDMTRESEKAAGELTFEIKAGETEIHIAFETVPYFRKRPHELNAVQWGSLLFSVPVSFDKKIIEYERDGVERKFPYCDYEFIPTSDWNYAYCSEELEVCRKGVGTVPFSGTNPPVVVKTKVQKIDWGLADGFDTVCAKKPESTEPISEMMEMELHPYGCAKLRMTELPKL
ncbi:MAG: hypothetical protein E7286_08445 [Lachnospiraceae bacterium]|nr:hypothetical protein [Lachnospiraceae bacterium]